MFDRLATLASVPLLRDAAPELRRLVAGACIEREVARGETVFLEGEAAKGLIVIARGALKIYKTGETGREQILEIEGPGRSVAELPLFDGRPYPASCEAIEDSTLLIVPAVEFHRLLARQPDLARAALASLSRRLRHMVSLVEEISLRDVRHRLVRLLLEWAGDSDVVELPLNNQQLAARIGTVREIVSRTLSRMVQEGAIRLEGRTLRLLDRSRL